MRKPALFCALLLLLLPLAAVAANNATGHCSSIRGEQIVEGTSFNAYMIIDGIVEPVSMTWTSTLPEFHGKSDRGSEYALVTSLLDGSSFYFYQEYTSTHTQNVFTVDPVLYARVNGTGTIVGNSGRWATASGHMTSHGPFNFAVPSMDIWFNGNVCGI